MKNLLLKNFLTNKSLYSRAQTRWRKFLDTLAAEAATPWTPYLDTSEDFDGNPLFSAHFSRRGRAVRIVQIGPKEATAYPPLIGWVDSIRLQESGSPTPELIVFILLTKETETTAHEWIRSWLLEGVSPRALERRMRKEAVLGSLES